MSTIVAGLIPALCLFGVPVSVSLFIGSVKSTTEESK